MRKTKFSERNLTDLGSANSKKLQTSAYSRLSMVDGSMSASRPASWQSASFSFLIADIDGRSINRSGSVGYHVSETASNYVGNQEEPLCPAMASGEVLQPRENHAFPPRHEPTHLQTSGRNAGQRALSFRFTYVTGVCHAGPLFDILRGRGQR